MRVHPSCPSDIHHQQGAWRGTVDRTECVFTGEERRGKGGREKEKGRKGKRSEEGRREGEENRGKERICSLSGFRSSMGF